MTTESIADWPDWLTPLDGDPALDALRRATLRTWLAATPHPLTNPAQPIRLTGGVGPETRKLNPLYIWGRVSQEHEIQNAINLGAIK